MAVWVCEGVVEDFEREIKRYWMARFGFVSYILVLRGTYCDLYFGYMRYCK